MRQGRTCHRESSGRGDKDVLRSRPRSVCKCRLTAAVVFCSRYWSAFFISRDEINDGIWARRCSQDGFKITVELSSVNRKQSEISVNLPREMEMLEAQIRDVINRYIARGRLTVRVGLHAGASKQSARMHLNVPLAKAYARELNRLSKQLKLPGPVTLDHLARAPGVFQTDEQIAEEEDFWPAVEKALKKALDAHGENARARRRASARRIWRNASAIMRQAAAQIQKHAPGVAERYREQLIERIKTAGLEAPASDDDRLLKEVVYFADRSDISEELTRLQSHFQQFDDCVQVERAGRPHAGFSGAGDEPRSQHDRLQSQRQPDFARSGDA